MTNAAFSRACPSETVSRCVAPTSVAFTSRGPGFGWRRDVYRTLRGNCRTPGSAMHKARNQLWPPILTDEQVAEHLQIPFSADHIANQRTTATSRITLAGDHQPPNDTNGEVQHPQRQPRRGDVDTEHTARVDSPADSAPEVKLPDEWLDRTIAVWQNYSSKRLTREDAERITQSGLRLIETLLKDD